MNTENKEYQKAKERVEEIKGFYTHLTTYTIVNVILYAINMITSPDSLWFIWPLMGWGVAVVLQALSVFGTRSGFIADWEKRKIEELMEQE